MDGVYCRRGVSAWESWHRILNIPGLEGYHNFPTVPKFFDKFIILVLPIPAKRSANMSDNGLSAR